jgi:hypothetical protein
MREASVSQQIIDPVLTLQAKKQEATAQNPFKMRLDIENEWARGIQLFVMFDRIVSTSAGIVLHGGFAGANFKMFFAVSASRQSISYTAVGEGECICFPALPPVEML